MPMMSTNDAIERLAEAVAKARPPVLAEILSDFFPDQTSTAPPSAADVAQRIQAGLPADEIVDLWNVVFPADHNVWFNEETDEIHYNEDAIDYADVD